MQPGHLPPVARCYAFATGLETGMLCVKTTVGESKIHGAGVFAAEDVPKGAVVWVFSSDFDRVFVESFADSLSGHQREWFVTHASLENGFWLLDGDNSKYMNHSGDPNIRCDGEIIMVAVSSIKAGDELTCDYTEFCEKSRAAQAFSDAGSPKPTSSKYDREFD